MSSTSTPEDDTILAEARAFVDDDPLAAAVLDWALDAVDDLGIRQDGEWELRVARTRLTFARRRGFLVVSLPERMGRRRYPVELSLGVDREIESDRFAAVAHPTKSMWMHHLWFPRDEGAAPLEGEAGEELRGWVAEAWEDAAPSH